jgi:hypothetical protein
VPLSGAARNWLGNDIFFPLLGVDRPRRAQEAQASPAAATPSPPGACSLRIAYAFTADDPLDGQPVLPGFADDGTYWARVTRLPDGRALWRRICLG